MRILYVLTSLGVGGAEKQAIAVAERMAARGHAVALIALKHTEEEWPVKLPVLRLNLKKTPHDIFRGLRFARKFLTLFRPDILHSHTFPANIFTRLLRCRARMNGQTQAIVNTIHNVYEGGWHRMLLYRLTWPLADCVTAVSTAAAERFLGSHAVSKKKMLILTNGIDNNAFAPDRSRRKRVRTKMRAAGSFVWIAVGRLVPAKDYPNLLEAWAQVRLLHPKAQLWIAGEGNLSDISSEETEPLLIRSHDAESSDFGVQWLGLRRDVADLLDAADGYVLSSAWEGMPLAVGEAMAMGKVTVATDVGGVRELIGDAGFIVPPRDSRALAEEMLKLMAMGERARQVMGQNAR